VGWKLVPVEPTEAMIEAGNVPRRPGYSIEWNTLATYRAMLSVSPPLDTVKEKT
jgi:hypothetical protein